MAAKQYSKYQQKVISDYYSNLDIIAISRLQEIVSDLYLAETDAKRQKLWQNAEKAMNNLKIPPKIVKHIMTKQDIEILARNVTDWLNKAQKK